MGHFDVLREAIAAHGGAVVKTMGDAVMAVFRRPAGALQAMLAVQERLAAPPVGGRPLWLKAAIHAGPAIAVQANERIDYFGTTVNQVARMVGFSSGEDVIITPGVAADPEVAAILAGNSLCSEPFEASFRGFEPDLIELLRVTRPRAEL
jgi:class 3 adenylate cyclase